MVKVPTKAIVTCHCAVRLAGPFGSPAAQTPPPAQAGFVTVAGPKGKAPWASGGTLVSRVICLLGGTVNSRARTEASRCPDPGLHGCQRHHLASGLWSHPCKDPRRCWPEDCREGPGHGQSVGECDGQPRGAATGAAPGFELLERGHGIPPPGHLLV